MKYWHYLIAYLLIGIMIAVALSEVSYEEESIRYGQPRVCLIHEPPESISAGRGAAPYFAIGFVLEDKGRVVNDHKNIYGGETKLYGLPRYGYYRCYSINPQCLSRLSRLFRWMHRTFVLSYGQINALSLDDYGLE